MGKSKGHTKDTSDKAKVIEELRKEELNPSKDAFEDILKEVDRRKKAKKE